MSVQADVPTLSAVEVRGSAVAPADVPLRFVRERGLTHLGPVPFYSKDVNGNWQNGVTSDNTIAWYYRGSRLEVFRILDGNHIASRDFKSSFPEVIEISSVIEYQALKKGGGRRSCLLTVLKTGPNKSCLVINRITSFLQYMHACVELPFVVESVDVIWDVPDIRRRMEELTGDSVTIRKRRIAGGSNGLVIAGSKEGRFYVIDVKYRPGSRPFDISQRTKVFRVVPVEHIAFDGPSIFSFLDSHESPSAVVFNESNCDAESFYVAGPGNRSMGVVPAEKSSITSVKFFLKIRCIAVGYKYGGFELWDIDTLQPSFSSAGVEMPGGDTPPVVGFEILEPDNDPRSPVFLFVLHSMSKKEDYIASERMEAAFARMYLFTFRHVINAGNVGCVYSDVVRSDVKLVVRFLDHILQRSPSKFVSRFVSSQSLRSPENRAANVPNEGILFLVFESWKRKDRDLYDNGVPHSREVAGLLFDVNVWYETQMTPVLPDIYFELPSLCSFLRAFDLTPVFSTPDKSTTAVIHACADGADSTCLTRFRAEVVHKDFGNASGLNLTALALHDRYIKRFAVRSYQSVVLATLAKTQPHKALLQPGTLLGMMTDAGLISAGEQWRLDRRSGSPADESKLRVLLLNSAIELNLQKWVAEALRYIWCPQVYCHERCIVGTTISSDSWKPSHQFLLDFIVRCLVQCLEADRKTSRMLYGETAVNLVNRGTEAAFWFCRSVASCMLVLLKEFALCEKQRIIDHSIYVWQRRQEDFADMPDNVFNAGLDSLYPRELTLEEWDYSLTGAQTLVGMYAATKLLLNHVELVLLLLENGILPEKNDQSAEHLPVPFDELRQKYAALRKRRKSQGLGTTLLIDVMISKVAGDDVRGLWELDEEGETRDEEAELYPPSHLLPLVEMFRVMSTDHTVLCGILTYFFKDCASVYPEGSEEREKWNGLRGKLLCRLGGMLTRELAADVLAYYALDHGESIRWAGRMWTERNRNWLPTQRNQFERHMVQEIVDAFPRAGAWVRAEAEPAFLAFCEPYFNTTNNGPWLLEPYAVATANVHGVHQAVDLLYRERMSALDPEEHRHYHRFLFDYIFDKYGIRAFWGLNYEKFDVNELAEWLKSREDAWEVNANSRLPLSPVRLGMEYRYTSKYMFVTPEQAGEVLAELVAVWYEKQRAYLEKVGDPYRCPDVVVSVFDRLSRFPSAGSSIRRDFAERRLRRRKVTRDRGWLHADAGYWGPNSAQGVAQFLKPCGFYELRKFQVSHWTSKGKMNPFYALLGTITPKIPEALMGATHPIMIQREESAAGDAPITPAPKSILKAHVDTADSARGEERRIRFDVARVSSEASSSEEQIDGTDASTTEVASQAISALQHTPISSKSLYAATTTSYSSSSVEHHPFANGNLDDTAASMDHLDMATSFSEGNAVIDPFANPYDHLFANPIRIDLGLSDDEFGSPIRNSTIDLEEEIPGAAPKENDEEPSVEPEEMGVLSECDLDESVVVSEEEEDVDEELSDEFGRPIRRSTVDLEEEMPDAAPEENVEEPSVEPEDMGVLSECDLDESVVVSEEDGVEEEDVDEEPEVVEDGAQNEEEYEVEGDVPENRDVTVDLEESQEEDEEGSGVPEERGEEEQEEIEEPVEDVEMVSSDESDSESASSTSSKTPDQARASEQPSDSDVEEITVLSTSSSSQSGDETREDRGSSVNSEASAEENGDSGESVSSGSGSESAGEEEHEPVSQRRADDSSSSSVAEEGVRVEGETVSDAEDEPEEKSDDEAEDGSDEENDVAERSDEEDEGKEAEEMEDEEQESDERNAEGLEVEEANEDEEEVEEMNDEEEQVSEERTEEEEQVSEERNEEEEQGVGERNDEDKDASREDERLSEASEPPSVIEVESTSHSSASSSHSDECGDGADRTGNSLEDDEDIYANMIEGPPGYPNEGVEISLDTYQSEPHAVTAAERDKHVVVPPVTVSESSLDRMIAADFEEDGFGLPPSAPVTGETNGEASSDDDSDVEMEEPVQNRPPSDTSGSGRIASSDEEDVDQDQSKPEISAAPSKTTAAFPGDESEEEAVESERDTSGSKAADETQYHTALDTEADLDESEMHAHGSDAEMPAGEDETNDAEEDAEESEKEEDMEEEKSDREDTVEVEHGDAGVHKEEEITVSSDEDAADASKQEDESDEVVEEVETVEKEDENPVVAAEEESSGSSIGESGDEVSSKDQEDEEVGTAAEVQEEDIVRMSDDEEENELEESSVEADDIPGPSPLDVIASFARRMSAGEESRQTESPQVPAEFASDSDDDADYQPPADEDSNQDKSVAVAQPRAAAGSAARNLRKKRFGGKKQARVATPYRSAEPASDSSVTESPIPPATPPKTRRRSITRRRSRTPSLSVVAEEEASVSRDSEEKDALAPVPRRVTRSSSRAASNSPVALEDVVPERVTRSRSRLSSVEPILVPSIGRTKSTRSRLEIIPEGSALDAGVQRVIEQPGKNKRRGSVASDTGGLPTKRRRDSVQSVSPEPVLSTPTPEVAEDESEISTSRRRSTRNRGSVPVSEASTPSVGSRRSSILLTDARLTRSRSRSTSIAPPDVDISPMSKEPSPGPSEVTDEDAPPLRRARSALSRSMRARGGPRGRRSLLVPAIIEVPEEQNQMEEVQEDEDDSSGIGDRLRRRRLSAQLTMSPARTGGRRGRRGRRTPAVDEA